MRYLLLNLGGDYRIVNDDANFTVGYVAPLTPDLRGPRFGVENVNGDEIAIVRSLKDAIPALAAYCEKNPPQWKRENATCYTKEDQFGLLRVEQVQPEQWAAYRDGIELLRNRLNALFATREEAQRAADAHVRDGYLNSGTINDGFSWLEGPEPWWTDPYIMANRAEWAA